jgi:GntR family transcriptional regulator
MAAADETPVWALRAPKAREPRREGAERLVEIAAMITEKVRARKTPKKKHARLQAALMAAVNDGSLMPGEQLPPEPELARAAEMSLGTVRRCLTRMAMEGLVTREHGRGTFIAEQVPAMNDIWHVRFLEPDGETQLPVYQHLSYRGIVEGNAEIAQILGPNESGYVLISRVMNIDSRFIAYSDFYLGADRFGGLLDASAAEIEAQGTKHFIADNFGARIVRIDKTVCMVPPPKHIADIIGLDGGEAAMHLNVIGYGAGNVPLSCQSIWIPPTDVPLDVTAGP